MEPQAPGWRDMERASPAYFAAETDAIPGLAAVDAPAHLRRGATGPGRNESSHYAAWRYLLQHARKPDARLVHGHHDAGASDGRTAHGWVELDGNLMFDGLTRRFYPADAFRAAVHAEVDHTYTAAEAARLMLRTDHPGPWTDQERHPAGVD